MIRRRDGTTSRVIIHSAGLFLGNTYLFMLCSVAIISCTALSGGPEPAEDEAQATDQQPFVSAALRSGRWNDACLQQSISLINLNKQT
jgi:hypothetical protein